MDENAGIDLFALWQAALAQIEAMLALILRPWNAYQLIIALVLYALAWGVARAVRPRLRAWLRAREGWPMWRMRLAVVGQKRLAGISFALLLWITVEAMRAVTWPSRSWLLALLATLVLAWLVIGFATRLIGNPVLRGMVWFGAVGWVTLDILGTTDEGRTFLDGLAMTVGNTRISVWLIIQAMVILGALFFLARVLSRTTSARLEKNKELSPSMRVLTIKFVQMLLYGFAFFAGLKVVGFDLTGLAVLSGAIGVGLGFGLQKVVSNLVSGIIILLDKSIKPGDVISLGETFGWIESLGARYVSVLTRDGKEYLIPNEDLITGQVVNWSHSNELVRLDLHFGTAYGDDPHLVRRVAVEAAPGVKRVLSSTKPVCHITGFGDSSVDYILRFWITDPIEGLTNIRGHVYLALWDAFKAHDISIPFPQREVRLLAPSGLDSLPPSR